MPKNKKKLSEITYASEEERQYYASCYLVLEAVFYDAANEATGLGPDAYAALAESFEILHFYTRNKENIKPAEAEEELKFLQDDLPHYFKTKYTDLDGPLYDKLVKYYEQKNGVNVDDEKIEFAQVLRDVNKKLGLGLVVKNVIEEEPDVQPVDNKINDDKGIDNNSIIEHNNDNNIKGNNNNVNIIEENNNNNDNTIEKNNNDPVKIINVDDINAPAPGSNNNNNNNNNVDQIPVNNNVEGNIDNVQNNNDQVQIIDIEQLAQQNQPQNEDEGALQPKCPVINEKTIADLDHFYRRVQSARSFWWNSTQYNDFMSAVEEVRSIANEIVQAQRQKPETYNGPSMESLKTLYTHAVGVLQDRARDYKAYRWHNRSNGPKDNSDPNKKPLNDKDRDKLMLMDEVLLGKHEMFTIQPRKQRPKEEQGPYLVFDETVLTKVSRLTSELYRGTRNFELPLSGIEFPDDGLRARMEQLHDSAITLRDSINELMSRRSDKTNKQLNEGFMKAWNAYIHDLKGARYYVQHLAPGVKGNGHLMEAKNRCMTAAEEIADAIRPGVLLWDKIRSDYRAVQQGGNANKNQMHPGM